MRNRPITKAVICILDSGQSRWSVGTNPTPNGLCTFAPMVSHKYEKHFQFLKIKGFCVFYS